MFGSWWHTNIDLITLILQIMVISVSVILSIHILLHKSDPKASLMWIALVWFAPFIGAVFYLIFGINRITRRARRLIDLDNADLVPAIKESFDFADDPWIEFRRLGNHITGIHRYGDNNIDVLEGVDVIHQSMIEAIDKATHSIALATYIFRRDDLGTALAEALVKADQRGVEVKVLLDGVGNGLFRTKIYRQLKKGGVDVKRFLHSIWPWRMPLMNLRNHRKLLVIDGQTAFTGSMNIGRVRNLETHFKIKGPVINQLIQAFKYDWQLSGGKDLSHNFYGYFRKSSGQIAARGILSGPIYSRENLRWIILGAVGAATKNIKIVTPYFIPDQGLLSGLILAALKGVQVDIILPKKSNFPFADWASHRQIKDLLLAGCNIYHRSGVFDHSKLMTIDGHWALIGSSNWDARSLRLNFEFDIECEDKIFVSRLDKFITDRQAKSDILSRSEFEDRSNLKKLRDACAWLFLPYL